MVFFFFTCKYIHCVYLNTYLHTHCIKLLTMLWPKKYKWIRKEEKSKQRNERLQTLYPVEENVERSDVPAFKNGTSRCPYNYKLWCWNRLNTSTLYFLLAFFKITVNKLTSMHLSVKIWNNRSTQFSALTSDEFDLLLSVPVEPELEKCVFYHFPVVSALKHCLTVSPGSFVNLKSSL